MNAKDTLIRGAFASLIALGLTTGATGVLAQDKGMTEKCAGAIKAGKNDCGASHSSCHGSVKMDGDKEAWVELPKGRGADVHRHGGVARPLVDRHAV